jgi:hypothetical protein
MTCGSTTSRRSRPSWPGAEPDKYANSVCNLLQDVQGKAERALADPALSAVWRDRVEQAAARVGLLQHRKA